MTEKIVITGSSGLIGRRLVKELLSLGYKAICIGRKPVDHYQGIDHLDGVNRISRYTWDMLDTLSFRRQLEGAKAVIHLAGEPVVGLMTPWKKRRILDSRVKTADSLLNIIQSLDRKPSIFISASAVGYYGNRGDKVLSESAGSGQGFLAHVCTAWEEVALKAEGQGCRSVVLRLGLVFDRNGGVLPVLKNLIKVGIGKMGSGTQWWPWIHVEDVIRIIIQVLEQEWRGSINAVAPQPTTQFTIAKSLAVALNKRIIFQVPEILLRMSGDLSSEVLNSKKVTPNKLLDQGFIFKYPALDEAVKDLVGG